MNTDARAFIEAQLSDFNAKRQAGIDLLNQHRKAFGNDALTLVKDQPEVERRPWCAVVIFPNPSGEGVRRTYFDAWGFSGHEVFKSAEEAAGDAYLSGYRRADPELLDSIALTDEFTAGVEWSMLPEDKKWNTSISKVLQEIKSRNPRIAERG